MQTPDGRRLSLRQRLLGIVLVTGLAIWIGAASVHRVSERLDPQPARAAAAPAVAVWIAEPDAFSVVGTYRGTVEADAHAFVAARVTALVQGIPYREGAIVQQGDILAHLDDEDLRLEHERLTAVAERLAGELGTARRERARQEELFGKRMAPERAVDEARQRVSTFEAQVRETDAGLKQLRARLAYTEERAPFDGVVQRVHVREGELAVAGQPLVELVALDGLKAVIHVPQSDAARIRTGLAVVLDVKALGERWQGTVDRVYPALDAGSRVATFAAMFPPGADQVRPGMAVEAQVDLAKYENAILVPAHAVHIRDDNRWVYLLEDGLVQQRLVQTGVSRDGFYHVTDGIRAGDPVIVTPDPRLEDGKVAVIARMEPR
jgi:membrane fusion protein, multidrug efflux system